MGREQKMYSHAKPAQTSNKGDVMRQNYDNFISRNSLLNLVVLSAKLPSLFEKNSTLKKSASVWERLTFCPRAKSKTFVKDDYF